MDKEDFAFIVYIFCLSPKAQDEFLEWYQYHINNEDAEYHRLARSTANGSNLINYDFARQSSYKEYTDYLNTIEDDLERKVMEMTVSNYGRLFRLFLEENHILQDRPELLI